MDSWKYSLSEKLPGHEISIEDFIYSNKTHSRKLLLVWLMSKVGYFGEEFSIAFCHSEVHPRRHWGEMAMSFFTAVFIAVEDGLHECQQCFCYEVFNRASKYVQEVDRTLAHGRDPFSEVLNRQEEVVNLVYSFQIANQLTSVGVVQQLLNELISEVNNVLSSTTAADTTTPGAGLRAYPG